MMRNYLLIAAIAFVAGISIGSFAVGQRQAPKSLEEVRYSTPQNAASTSLIVQNSPDSPLPDQADEPSVSGEDKAQADPLNKVPETTGESEQIQVLHSRWTNLESLVDLLATRVRGLEQELTAIKSDFASEREELTEGTVDVLPVDTPEDRRIALVAAGVPQTTAEEIVWQQSELEMERLELQDQAMREDWYRTSRYYRALRELNGQTLDLRAEIGEQAYDRYLYQTGEPNRVNVKSVIQGSAAEQSGLLPGDIIETYGGERVYTYSDLRSATTRGLRGETVPVLIRRGNDFMEVIMDRGPMGVRLESRSASPDG